VDRRFLLSLLSTLLVELPLLAIVLRLFGEGRRLPLTTVLSAGALASIATLPYLWFLVPRIVPGPYYLPVGETLVMAAEALILRLVLGLRPLACVMASALCNLGSWLAGGELLRLLARIGL
jgi:hypothetical protein